MDYPLLFSPIKINQLLVPNRIVATPTGDEFEEKALGGAGIVICGHTIVEDGRSSFASPAEPYLFSKYSVEEAQSRIRKTHAAGAKASIELFHGGLYARVKDFARGPQDVVREDGTVVKAMTMEDMELVANKFGEAAKDAKNLGFDMVFLHFGHGWLPAQFLSPYFNKRDDEFGGSFENRSKFPRMIVDKVREAVGPHFPIDLRISAIEWVEGSIEFEDTLKFIQSIEKTIDTVQISAGLDINHEANVHMVTTNFSGHMVNSKFSKIVKEHVSIPVSVVGAVMNPDQAEYLLANGYCDLVAFGRAFIADPNWPNKAKQGLREDIVPCIRCLQCYHIATNRRNVGCSVNPRYKNETFVPANVELAPIKKKVVVIGAGPAGITAAVTSAKRGHEVILFEKSDVLGGQLNLIIKENYKEDIKDYLDFLKQQVKKYELDVRLNTEATPAILKELNPDVFFVATGARPFVPPIKGLDQNATYSFDEVIKDKSKVKGNVVIIGGGTIGAELALGYAEKGFHVSIVEMLNQLAIQGNMLYKIALRQKLEKLDNLDVYLETKVKEIQENKVSLETKEGDLKAIVADTVVIATGVRANRDHEMEWMTSAKDVYFIGDCEKPRKIMEAVFEGFSIASKI